MTPDYAVFLGRRAVASPDWRWPKSDRDGDLPVLGTDGDPGKIRVEPTEEGGRLVDIGALPDFRSPVWLGWLLGLVRERNAALAARVLHATRNATWPQIVSVGVGGGFRSLEMKVPPDARAVMDLANKVSALFAAGLAAYASPDSIGPDVAAERLVAALEAT